MLVIAAAACVAAVLAANAAALTLPLANRRDAKGTTLGDCWKSVQTGVPTGKLAVREYWIDTSGEAKPGLMVIFVAAGVFKLDVRMAWLLVITRS